MDRKEKIEISKIAVGNFKTQITQTNTDSGEKH